MMSLFVSFDLFFFSTFMMIMTMMTMNMLSSTFKMNLFSNIMYFIMAEMKKFFYSLNPKSFPKTMIWLTLSVMMLIFMLNFSSILPYNFSLTSQFSLVMSVSLSIWVSMMIFYMINNSKGMIMHYIPEGAPIYLTWFLFLIEIVSNMIRPMTLSIRLVANILAGHLLMILLSKMVMKLMVMSTFYIALNMVEIFVSIIQAYIFVTMLNLYYSELH